MQNQLNVCSTKIPPSSGGWWKWRESRIHQGGEYYNVAPSEDHMRLQMEQLWATVLHHCNVITSGTIGKTLCVKQSCDIKETGKHRLQCGDNAGSVCRWPIRSTHQQGSWETRMTDISMEQPMWLCYLYNNSIQSKGSKSYQTIQLEVLGKHIQWCCVKLWPCSSWGFEYLTMTGISVGYPERAASLISAALLTPTLLSPWCLTCNAIHFQSYINMHLFNLSVFGWPQIVCNLTQLPELLLK